METIYGRIFIRKHPVHGRYREFTLVDQFIENGNHLPALLHPQLAVHAR